MPAHSVPALQLFNPSTHAWLRNAATKQHSRTSVSSGESTGVVSEHSIKQTLQQSTILLNPGGSSQDLLGPVLNFFQSMATLRVTETEYTLLTATVLLCSGLTANQDFSL